MSWNQSGQQGEFELVDSLGKDLSAIIHCPVRFCAYHFDKPIFQCKCNVSFPKFAVQAAQESGDWHDIMVHHRGEY